MVESMCCLQRCYPSRNDWRRFLQSYTCLALADVTLAANNFLRLAS